MKKLYSIFLVFVLFFLLACDKNEDISQAQDDHNLSVTQWTDKMEIFMEYPFPVLQEPVQFIIHLTTMDDFKPVTEGTVKLNFVHESGQEKTVVHDRLLREGIFTPTTNFSEKGNYNFTLTYSGKKTSETFQIGSFVVYGSHNEVPHEHGAAVAVETISFLKEQQWKIEFETEPVQKKKIKSSILASGEILPKQQYFAEIVSPVDGILDIKANQKLAAFGQEVQEGELLATLTPPLNITNSWAEIHKSYQISKNEFERASRLKEKNSISEREFEEIKSKYEVKKAGYNSLFGKESSSYIDSENYQFVVVSPLKGVVNEVFVKLGQKIPVGNRLFTIINPAKVFLKVNIYEKDYYKIKEIGGATIKLAGLDSLIHLSKNEMRMLSKGEIINKENLTIPFLFELDNFSRLFKVGQVVQIQLYTSSEEEFLAVPRGAVFDDNALKVVYIHKEGETFERREVITGDSYQNWIAILSGIEQGESVVTKGGYQVKLASTSEQVGHGHTH